jgi:hypothetical protein
LQPTLSTKKTGKTKRDISETCLSIISLEWKDHGDLLNLIGGPYHLWFELTPPILGNTWNGNHWHDTT